MTSQTSPSQLPGILPNASSDASSIITPSDLPDPLAQLRDALPADLAPWVDRFGPIFIAMTADQLRSWVSLASGDQSADAYRQLVEALPDERLITEWDQTIASWSALNDANAQRMAQNKAALDDAIAALLKIGLAALLSS